MRALRSFLRSNVLVSYSHCWKHRNIVFNAIATLWKAKFLFAGNSFSSQCAGMASGTKQILLSPVSPNLQSLTKKIAVFPSQQRIKNCDESEPTSPSCSTPRGLDSVSTNVVRKRLTGSADEPSRSRKKLFDSSHSEVSVPTSLSLASLAL